LRYGVTGHLAGNSAGVVEAGNRVADEPADHFGSVAGPRLRSLDSPYRAISASFEIVTAEPRLARHGDTVREVTPSRLTLERHSPGQICRKSVVEEKADSLRLLIVVAACGALIASPGNLPQILVAHLYPQFAEPAAPALAQRPHSLGRCRDGGLPPSGMVHKTVPKA
jgi:hypothetical protein